MSNLTAQQMEGAIVTQVILDALAAGYRIDVDNGEEIVTPLQTLCGIIVEMGATECGDWLRFHGIGWAHFIYGNDGYDVIADYAANPATKALLAEYAANAESEHSARIAAETALGALTTPVTDNELAGADAIMREAAMQDDEIMAAWVITLTHIMQLRQRAERAETECAALQAWQNAVPVDDWRNYFQAWRGVWIDQYPDLYAWLDTLPQPATQPDFLPARNAAPWASEQMPEAIES